MCGIAGFLPQKNELAVSRIFIGPEKSGVSGVSFAQGSREISIGTGLCSCSRLGTGDSSIQGKGLLWCWDIPGYPANGSLERRRAL